MFFFLNGFWLNNGKLQDNITDELNLQKMSCVIAQGSIYPCKARMSQVLCTCHQLTPGVGPQANKGNM